MRSAFVKTFLRNRWTGYDYAVPGGHQGRWERLRVIGDKQGRRTLKRIHHKPELLDRLRDTVRCELKMLHVIRNPFDSIATMHNRKRSVMKAMRRAGTTGVVLPDILDRKIATYFEQSRRMEEVRTTHKLEILDIYHEEYLEEPIGGLATIIEFLGLSASDDYLKRCASVALTKPRQSRFSIEWPSWLHRFRALAHEGIRDALSLRLRHLTGTGGRSALVKRVAELLDVTSIGSGHPLPRFGRVVRRVGPTGGSGLRLEQGEAGTGQAQPLAQSEVVRLEFFKPDHEVQRERSGSVEVLVTVVAVVAQQTGGKEVEGDGLRSVHALSRVRHNRLDVAPHPHRLEPEAAGSFPGGPPDRSFARCPVVLRHHQVPWVSDDGEFQVPVPQVVSEPRSDLVDGGVASISGSPLSEIRPGLVIPPRLVSTDRSDDVVVPAVSAHCDFDARASDLARPQETNWCRWETIMCCGAFSGGGR